jgi:RNA polymerase sigma-70 factor (ECF subfamily)
MPEAVMTDNAERLYERLVVLRCQAGDEAAFAELVERYQSRLRYYLRKMLFGVREPDDVLQEVWLDVFRAIPRLKDAGAFRAWLYRIARDHAFREFRKRRLNFQPLDQEELPVEIGRDEDIFAAEDAARVHSALQKLAAAHREVLVLRFIEDMSYEETASVLGCQIGTVRSRLYYAKRALRGALEKDQQS